MFGQSLEILLLKTIQFSQIENSYHLNISLLSQSNPSVASETRAVEPFQGGTVKISYFEAITEDEQTPF